MDRPTPMRDLHSALSSEFGLECCTVKTTGSFSPIVTSACCGMSPQNLSSRYKSEQKSKVSLDIISSHSQLTSLSIPISIIITASSRKPANTSSYYASIHSIQGSQKPQGHRPHHHRVVKHSHEPRRHGGSSVQKRSFGPAHHEILYGFYPTHRNGMRSSSAACKCVSEKL
ncbi:hypothetical protein BJ508DRAFT_81886 [Ascobolus immersus RN42]|uniref:Uncharacterized protein n=1 Tax=Ascobolus immersus RN42 TaxID=1160509 RepID=A0A3N4HQU3_ASCIM|nr:hypothetical protein BJ508DRAFT_81886 [Ascobolus immersus RN42]